MLQVVNLKKLVRRIGKVQIQVQPTKLVLQPCREASVALLEHSSIFTTQVTGGVPRSTMLQLHGAVS